MSTAILEVKRRLPAGSATTASKVRLIHSSFYRRVSLMCSVGKLSRFVKEIQGHMRLRASGDRHEIRQQYLPTLWNKMVKKLEVEGKECVEDVIDLMDSYFLTKEDYDAIVELGLGPMDMEKVNIESQTKATFTRLYVIIPQDPFPCYLGSEKPP